MVTIEAVAAYGHSGQYVAQINGRKAKVTFCREFVGRKTGKRGEATTFHAEEIAMFEVQNVDKKGRKEREYYATLPDAGGDLRKWYLTEEEAMVAAGRMDNGETLEQIFELSLNENTGKLAAFLREPKKAEPAPVVEASPAPALKITGPKRGPGRPRKTVAPVVAEVPSATQIVSVEGESTITFPAGYLPGLAPDAQGKLFND